MEGVANSVVLSIIIVNHNSSGPLKDCLESIAASIIDVAYEVIVVDNSPSRAGLRTLKEAYSAATFIELSDNRGFAAGNNAGIKAARGRALLLLNPDTVLEPHAIQRLYGRLMSSNKTGIVGPMIHYPDGSLQSEVLPKKIPGLKDLFFELFLVRRAFPGSEAMSSYHGVRGFDFYQEQKVEQVSGACLMIKKEVIDAVGLMDEKFFLYFEETDWCLRALKAGYEIFYVPSASITHLEGASAPRCARRAVERFYASELYFIKKHYGNPQAVLLFFLNAAGFVFRLLIAPAILLKEKNTNKVRRSFWGLAYHLNIIHLIEAIRT